MEIELEAKMTVEGDKIDLPEPMDEAIDQVEQEMRRMLDRNNWKFVRIDWGDEVCSPDYFSFEILARRIETIEVTDSKRALSELVSRLRSNYEELMANSPFQIAHVAIYPTQIRE